MAKTGGNALVRDLILSCTGKEVPSEIAQKAVRAICRYYGGQMIYIPAKKENGSSAGNLRGVIADAVGDLYAEKILGKIMALYGAMQIYIPMERKAFRTTIALEIYERYRGGRGNGPSMNDLAREYGIATNTGYELWEVGQKEKIKSSTPYLPFPELGENINPG